ncbi:MAG: DUF4394 domain-containing protein [Actinobacteria bacterium]|nr:DUF4394 domain-containing protein [Actinomycetota bacterium]
MQLRPRPSSARSRARVVTGLLVAALVTAVTAFLPAAPASAARPGVTKQGTLGNGYLFVASDGGIFNYGDSEFFGSTGNIALNKPVVDSASTPTGEGYWLVAADGGIFSFGDAEFFGSTGAIKLNAPIVGMQRTATGRGYWLVASDGGIFSFGDAAFYGSAGAIKLNKPIVGMDRTASGLGYYLVAEDGGIFTYGDATFFGSTGAIKLNKPIVGMEATDDGDGYYLVASDGGIFSFGRTADDAQFFGSTGAIKLNQPVVDMALTASNLGYWLVAADGGIFAFGDAPFLGSTGDIALNRPVVGMDRTPNSPLEAPDFAVNLRGSAEVPGPGDPDGRAAFALFDFTRDEICYSLRVDNIAAATAAHIHEAPAGVAGPVLVTLVTPDANGVVSACQDVDPAIIADIVENPQNYYVNIHNAEFPGGAVRGQLQGEIVLATTADNNLVAFNTEFPGFVQFTRPITGLGTAETIAGIDYRPANDALYALTVTGATSDTGKIYTINEDTGAATLVGQFTHSFLGATSYGFDFNPVSDRIRIVSDANDSVQVNPDTGALIQADPDLNAPYGDPNVVGVAYTGNLNQLALPADQRATMLFGIDSGQDALVQITFGTGATALRGPLGVGAGNIVGFDIAPSPADEPGTGVALIETGTATAPATQVYGVNYTTSTEFGNAQGKATLLGTVGDTTLVLTAVTVA